MEGKVIVPSSSDATGHTFIFQFAPRSSQVCARRKFAEAAGAPRRPHRGGTGREQSSPVLLPLLQPVRLLGSSGCPVPFFRPQPYVMPHLVFSFFFTLAVFLLHNSPPVSNPQGGPRGHPVIRCPSDVFTFAVTANTSGAHIQVIPVPLDTFHEIISEVVMAIFSHQLCDRNCFKRVRGSGYRVQRKSLYVLSRSLSHNEARQ
ncbi:hypothetical protein IRJ41_010893 [Triplophysa rosa]|uniref:Uncharacterized protein n=1 Tax=Triplophysa rosa TaxID=992332 RepID=A0A9W7WZT5_TRIRA|nr:hypothetical protein IRJ41_010893 [Triplophysa rosa]